MTTVKVELLLCIRVHLSTREIQEQTLYRSEFSVMESDDESNTEYSNVSTRIKKFLEREAQLLRTFSFSAQRNSVPVVQNNTSIAEPESPIMLMWFATNVCIGVYNVITYEPSILKAASPHYILKFFVRNGKTAFDLLGAVFLSIRVGFLFRGLSVVILTYAGETAYFTKNPEKITDAYYSSIPENVYWPMFVISTLAAVVSSQFMISATFSIVKQSLSLDCFPRVNIIHTSSKHQGQIYSPEINYILMILTLGLVVGYKGGVELANAYGTVLRSYMGNDHNDVHVGRVHFHDVVIKENPTRRMGSVCISAFFLTVVLSWRYGRIKKTTYEAERKMSIEELDQMLSLNNNIYRTQGICFFFTNLVYGIPPITEDRYNVGKLGNEGVYRCLVRFGYKDSWNMKEDEYVASVLTELQELTNITTNEEHTTQTAAEKEIVYVVGRTILKANKENGTLARLTIGYLYRFLQKNSRAAVSTLEIPPERTLQIGMTYEI
ncbi:PREDICTED: potassium transporter 26-like [Erythranthe guttata]|uniref:potassium transporter 26-like n=1 Tax=Erythranthe guttata TaxID=4155 RepID=UPI00064D9D20|nr:PREDICTED: potassium transporter 26-like [Erythranthe guttata]|eukprot:XP_012851939.1 PREDICTED: potassium transporter 26-like [Erythranthe guttata]